jgi:glyoxylase-like metal-dependent hydrolase (beta-lactamase superfamily II)
VLEVPGHSPGALAFWRARDRVLVCGDVLANFGLHPSRPRLVLAPAALSSDYDQNRRSAARMAGLRPRLACFGHGFAVSVDFHVADWAQPARLGAAGDGWPATSVTWWNQRAAVDHVRSGLVANGLLMPSDQVVIVA